MAGPEDQESHAGVKKAGTDSTGYLTPSSTLTLEKLTPRSQSPERLSPSPSSSREDPEIPQAVINLLEQWQLDLDHRTGIVSCSPTSRTHPRNWSHSRKLYDTFVICLFEFFTTVISNTGSSVARYADLGISQTLSIFCFVTLYLFGQAIGGIIFPPVAEVYGGRTIYVVGAVGFTALCAIMGAEHGIWSVVLGRFGSGLCSAMPTVVAIGSLVSIRTMMCPGDRANEWRRKTFGISRVGYGQFMYGFRSRSLRSR